MIINNDTEQYVNQYHDIIDVPETKRIEPNVLCGCSSWVAMITGEDPNDVLDYFYNKFGYEENLPPGESPHFQWQELLIKYIEDRGFKCNKILIKAAYPDPREITDDELKRMMVDIRNGKVILYHKKGHYQIMTGFTTDEQAFIFNDPAGDRKFKRSLRFRTSGHGAVYPIEMVKREKIYGQCYSVEI